MCNPIYTIMIQRLLFFLSFLLAVTFMACSSDDPGNNGSSKPTQTSAQNPDPEPATPTESKPTFSFNISSASGQGTTAQPFTGSPGNPLNATLSQTVTYTDAQGKQQTVQPKATIAVTMKTDTIHTADPATLTNHNQSQPTVSTKDGNPKTATIQQKFDIGGQEIIFDVSYEIYSYTDANGKQVELPYVKLGEPELVDVKITKSEQTKVAQSRLAGRKYTLPKGQTRADDSSDISNLQGYTERYKVTASFRQKLQAMNTQEPKEEMMEYSVTYDADAEVKLISTNYEKDYEWWEPWCDLPWRYNYIVRRVRTYSTGEKETDEFVLPTGTNVSPNGSIYQIIEDKDILVGPLHVIYHNENYDINNDDFKHVRTTKTGVSDITLISGKITEDEDTWNERNFNRYRMVFSDEFYNPSSPKENWYDETISRIRSLQIFCNATGHETEWIRLEPTWINFGDWFLYIDGQIIEFPEYRMTCEVDFREENISFNGSPAKVFTNEIKGKYLGKDFYAATVDTVYQIK